MRNVKTREGFEYWDKICSLKHYGFLHSPDGTRVVKTEGIGNWIDKFEAQEIVDQAQDEINQYRAERDALQKRLTAADERADVLERVEARYRWLQKATPYRFKKIQDASVTDGGDVLYFHADRFDAAVDAELKPGEVKPDEHACTGCGAKGWTANCKECVPY